MSFFNYLIIHFPARMSPKMGTLLFTLSPQQQAQSNTISPPLQTRPDGGWYSTGFQWNKE
jgi:hypothetical protein